MGLFSTSKLPDAQSALPGRTEKMPVPELHEVLGTRLEPPFPDGAELAMFGLGCFWGAERVFWQLPGVISTAVGYSAGQTPNPTYEEVCSGLTGHNEVVRVVFDPARISYGELVAAFFEAHDPTQGMRQGNDRGTQYRSGIYTHSAAQSSVAEAMRTAYGERLGSSGMPAITTEIRPAGTFYYAEHYHQQYLHKAPNGYCGLGGTGISCPVAPAVGAPTEAPAG